MPASTHQLAASAYHIRPADMRKLLLAATNFRDRCLIKTLWWLGVRRSELIQLDVRDLDVERKRVTVQAGKGGDEGAVETGFDVEDLVDEFGCDALGWIEHISGGILCNLPGGTEEKKKQGKGKIKGGLHVLP